MTFQVTDNKGVRIEFANGYTVSIQWGAANYCDNQYTGTDVYRKLSTHGLGVPPSKTAEVAVIKDGHFVRGWPHCEKDDVCGWLKPEHVLDILMWAAKQPAKESTR